jgi:hypothetical protein
VPVELAIGIEIVDADVGYVCAVFHKTQNDSEFEYVNTLQTQNIEAMPYNAHAKNTPEFILEVVDNHNSNSNKKDGTSDNDNTDDDLLDLFGDDLFN